jgi:hypothetical protein
MPKIMSFNVGDVIRVGNNYHTNIDLFNKTLVIVHIDNYGNLYFFKDGNNESYYRLYPKHHEIRIVSSYA